MRQTFSVFENWLLLLSAQNSAKPLEVFKRRTGIYADFMILHDAPASAAHGLTYREATRNIATRRELTARPGSKRFRAKGD